MLKKDTALEVDNYAGLVPPIPAYNTDSAYTDFWPATQTFFANLLPVAKAAPSSADFKVWAYALAQSTETLVLHPDTSIDKVLADMKTYVEGQLGANTTETE